MSPVASRRMVSPAASSAVAPVVTSPSQASAAQPSRSIERVERPFDAPVGGAQRARQPRRRGLVEAHRHPGVANLVVLGRGRVVLGVVEVEPGAVGVLVADEPIDAGLRRASELRRGHRRAALRRRRDRERDAARISARVRPARQTRSSRSCRSRRGRGGRRGGAGPGSANHAVSGRRLKTTPRPAPRGAWCRPGPRPQAAEPGGAGSTRKRASQSSPRTTAPNRRWPAAVGSMRITRSRVEGTAQTTSTAMPRSENTWTDAEVSIVDVEDDGDPDGRVAAARATTARPR